MLENKNPYFHIKIELENPNSIGLKNFEYHTHNSEVFYFFKWLIENEIVKNVEILEQD